jgi:hypothetical protein
MDELLLKDVINQLLDKPLIIQLPLLNKNRILFWNNKNKIIYLHISTLSITFKAFRADHPPIETWSSWPALVEILSTDDGWHRTLFSETKNKEQLNIE